MAGRGRKGKLNKTTLEIRELAKQYGPECIAALVKIVRTSKVEDSRMRAASIILDRGYGKSVQPVTNDEDNPLRLLIEHLEGSSRGLPSEHS